LQRIGCVLGSGSSACDGARDGRKSAPL
jgi:hypothetical protein